MVGNLVVKNQNVLFVEQNKKREVNKMAKVPFGMTEEKWNNFCDDIKDYNGSYESFFTMMEKCNQLQKERQQNEKNVNKTLK